MCTARYGLIAVVAYVAGLLTTDLLTDVQAQNSRTDRPKIPATDDETLARVRKSITGSKWNLGGSDWIHFLSDMKTTNHLNRTGNWVVTDAQTILTGGRGTTGSIYVWKLQKGNSKATIYKYNRDPKYRKTVTRRP